MKHVPSKSSMCGRSTSGHPKKNLRFATFINYPARKEYSYHPTPSDVLTVREAGYHVSAQEASGTSSPVTALASSPPPAILFGPFHLSPEYPLSVSGNPGSPAGLKFIGPDFVDIPDSPQLESLGPTP